MTPPTPVFEVPELGLWVKDDSVIGGNKVRKLAYTIPDAQAKGKRTVLTFGAIGSNHCVATAEACRDAGLACICVLVDQPEDVREEIVSINTDVRPKSLQIALLVPLLAALAGLGIGLRMVRLPDR